MSSNGARTLVVLASIAALAGCNTMNSHIGDEDPAMGEAVKYNNALQTINPLPVYPAAAAQPGADADKGAHAVKRYRTDAVKQPETTTTTGGSGGGSPPH